MQEHHQTTNPSRSHAGAVRPDLSLAAEPQTAPSPGTADMAGPLSVRVLPAHEHDQDAAVISVRGEIDLRTAPTLSEALLPTLEHDTGPVVVDLSEVTFIDSTGVHVLFETLQRLELKNRRLAIVCREGGQVHKLLDLVGLVDIVAVYRSRDSALIGGDDLLRAEQQGPAD